MFQLKKLVLHELPEIIHQANLQIPLETLRECNHIQYLYSYLGTNGLDAKFYFKEDEYISIDYLSDYSYYYSRSFTNYKSKCVRIHFFTSDTGIECFNKELTDKIIHGSGCDKESDQYRQYNDFWHKFYLGFIVIRPIPAFLGFTLLKHYNYIDNPPQRINRYDPNRKFWGVKEYIIHISGNAIKINDTLAFMSQDGNVAACATIAIWCMLHRAVEDYHINLKSPYEITRDVGNILSTGDRIFPNSGLDLVSICQAISKCNLAPVVKNFFNPDTNKLWSNANSLLKLYINAYCGLRLPLILGLDVWHDGKYKGHAVAICGHSYKPHGEIKGLQIQNLPDFNDIIMEADRIDKIFAHDDQTGPFCKIIIKGNKKLYTSLSSGVNRHIKTKKPDIPRALIIPLFQKVRISLEDITECTYKLHAFFSRILKNELESEFSWNIQIKYAIDFKAEIQNRKELDLNDKFEKTLLLAFLNENLPKYIWISTLHIDNEELICFIYDATALKHCDCLLTSFSSDLKFWGELIAYLNRIRLIPRNDEANIELISYLSCTIEIFTEKISKLYNIARNECDRE